METLEELKDKYYKLDAERYKLFREIIKLESQETLKKVNKRWKKITSKQFDTLLDTILKDFQSNETNEVRKNWDVAYHRISLSICQWNVRWEIKYMKINDLIKCLNINDMLL